MQKGKMFLFFENTQEKKSNLILVLECKEVYCLYRGAPWVRKFENVTVKKTFAGTAQTTWNRFKLRYFDWPIPVFVRWWRHLMKTGTGIGQSKYLNLTLFHVVWSVPAKVFLTVAFSIPSKSLLLKFLKGQQFHLGGGSNPKIEPRLKMLE